MPSFIYFLVFFASFLVDVIPLIGPPAWTVMVFFQIKFDLNIWLVLFPGVIGSAIGRYYYSIYVKWLAERFVKEEKNHDLLFLGSRLSGKGWKIQLFVFFIR
jgi:NADH:ubiquinone oxidoreductase subunit 2 (subunit N)